MTPQQRAAELRRTMRQRGMTPRAVADVVCKSPQAVRCWLRGTRNMPESALKLLRLSQGG